MQFRPTTWVLLIVLLSVAGFVIWRARVTPAPESCCAMPHRPEYAPPPESGSQLDPPSLPQGGTAARGTTAVVAIPGRAEGDEGGRVALEAWAKRGDEQAVNAIIGAAETNSAIREHAIILLGGMKSDLAAAYLATQVTNEDERIACRAVTELPGARVLIPSHT